MTKKGKKNEVVLFLLLIYLRKNDLYTLKGHDLLKIANFSMALFENDFIEVRSFPHRIVKIVQFRIKIIFNINQYDRISFVLNKINSLTGIEYKYSVIL